MEIWLYYGGIALIFVVFALSLNLLLGFAGQVSVAHAAFGAIGGYAVGYLTLTKGWNFVPALLIGIGIAFAAGTIVALPAMRLSVEYLILLTLAISSVIIGAFTTFPELGGTYGLINLPKAELFGWTLQDPSDWVLPLVVVAVFTYWLTDRLGESPYGRVLRGIREDPQAVQSLGKNVVRFKLSVFAITSALAALAGGLLSAFLQLATPSLFGFSISLTIFAMVILGGMGNLTGSVIGAAVLASLDPILTRVIGLSADKAGFVQFIVYGLLLVVLMRLRPEGVLPEGFSLVRWARRQQQPLAGRVEMVRAEGWVPKVSPEVAQLARAEHEFLEETATVTAGAPVTGNGDAEQARAGLWAAAPVVLEVNGLSKRFGGIIAAHDLTFTLRQGAIAALVGPNGAGKTTVFNLLTGFIPSDTGSVRLRGVELVGAPPDQVARMGMVRSFQDVRLFQRLSCLTNVAMAVPDQPGERVPSLLARPGTVRRTEAQAIETARGWLEFVGLQEFAGIPAGALSYGQTKLVSLARVLATEAEVILLDEPASGIDDVWVDTMLGLIESLRDKGRTICIVEHNLHVVGRLADHTYFMELGRITAEGTIGELTGSERLAEAYFGTV
jgi:branched-chain amino acid transport system permease protein